MTKIKVQLTKFITVGFVNSVLIFSMFFVLLRVFNINHTIALTTSWIAGIGFSYLLNYSWVFKQKQEIQFKNTFFKYFLSYLFLFALNLIALHCIVRYTGFDSFYFQTELVPFIVILNFTSSKFWSLRTINT